MRGTVLSSGALVVALVLSCGDEESPPIGEGGGAATTGATTGTGDEGGQMPQGGGGHGPWSCIGNVVWPPLEAQGELLVQLNLIDVYVETAHFEGLTVKACDRDDQLCSSPLDTNVSGSTGCPRIDDGPVNPGHVCLHVPISGYPDGFDGYYEVEPGTTMAGESVVRNLIMTVQPETNDPNHDQGAVAQYALDGFADLAGIELDPSRGHLLIEAKDCSHQDAAGVTMAVDGADPMVTTHYFDDNTLTPDAALTETSASGIVVIANMPPGVATVRAFVPGSGNALAGVTDVVVRPGGVTSFGFPPTPLP